MQAVSRDNTSVRIKTIHGQEHYDQLILACHSDQALRLLQDASDQEAEILGKLERAQVKRNPGALHRHLLYEPAAKFGCAGTFAGNT